MGIASFIPAVRIFNAVKEGDPTELVHPFAQPLVDGLKGSGQADGSVAPTPAPLPEAPKPEVSAAKAEETVKKRKAAMTKTTFSDPLGLAGQADIVRKSLTGQ